MDLTSGARVDRYVLLELLGEGGQGSVWKAEDLLHPGTLVALKLVPLALSRPNDVERVRREARALARLEHPTLVASHALFEDLKLSVLGIAMDFVDGAALRKHEDDPRLTPEHRVTVLGHIAHVLAYVHQRGVSHRDLKLDNVLVTRAFWQEPHDSKNVKLVDFGIAKLDAPLQPLTQLDTIIGTLAYLAPEQLDPAHFGEGTAPSADVFAFGILGWRLLFGGHP
ncbi:MAG TPA: serine/threonine-protein kinase, partial [Polyangiaceae bacterium]|nr:serine/threonine-protein kinase [Polyangiaceae bacterium]